MSEAMKEQIHDTIISGVRLSYDVDRVLARETTPYQDLALIENERFGRVMLLDGASQVTTADEFIYHEMLAHVPLCAHPAARDVLIIGGGDCGLAEEVLKHEQLRRVVQVEIDPRVVDVSRHHLAEINAGVFEDPRFQLRICDGVAFLDGLHEQFDVVLVDSTDPIGAAAKLFTTNFYNAVRRALRVGGVVVAQAGVPFFQPTEFSAAVRNMAGAFEIVSCYLLASPSYFGGHLALTWGSDSLNPPSNEDPPRSEIAAMKLRYYTQKVASAAFVLPAYIQQLLDAALANSSSRKIA